jgi:hypothetical protein
MGWISVEIASDINNRLTLSRVSVLTPLLVDLGEEAVAVAGVISLLQMVEINFLSLILRQQIIMGETALIPILPLSDIKREEEEEALDTTPPPLGLILLEVIMIMTWMNLLKIL